MNFFGFNKKSAKITRDKEKEIIGVELKNANDYLGVFDEGVIMQNLPVLFETISEISFPIVSIARGVASGNYQLRDSNTDAIIYDNERINQFLSKPYPLYTFQEMLYLIECYQMVTGNSYLYAAVGFEALSKNRWKYCNSYSVLPSQYVSTVLVDNPKIFTAEKITDIIKGYKVSDGRGQFFIEPWNAMVLKNYGLTIQNGLNCGVSPLMAAKYPICNLIESYQARNAIFVKRGALGALVSKKSDASGNIPLTTTEKKNIRDEYNLTYGVTNGKSPVMISELPLDFLRMSMSIQELMPFDEHLEDAIQIAGVFEFPPDLIPRKDKSTFANQDNSEIGLYNKVIIPRANTLVQALNGFLGLEDSGMYLSVNFNHVSVLQPKRKAEAETDKIISETSKANFYSGIITLNDWIAKAGGEKKSDPFYDKYVFDMDEEELLKLKTIKELI